MKTPFSLPAWLLVAILNAPQLPCLAASTINTNAHHAWSANAGWIVFRPERPNTGDGIQVHDTFLSGYAWSPNLGWIHFGDGTPINSLRYANTAGTDFGVNQDGAGNLSGLAWSANTGWINFGWADSTNPNRPRFNIATGEFAGFAWSANCGWINLGTGILRTDTMTIADTDGDGIADSWERERAGSLPVLTSSGDADGDGISDKNEYLLDTDPMTPSAPLRIARISKLPDADAVELEWPSSPRRHYAIEAKVDLNTPEWLFLDNVAGGSGTNTVQAIEQGPPNAFFRIGAKLPLSP